MEHSQVERKLASLSKKGSSFASLPNSDHLKSLAIVVLQTRATLLAYAVEGFSAPPSHKLEWVNKGANSQGQQQFILSSPDGCESTDIFPVTSSHTQHFSNKYMEEPHLWEEQHGSLTYRCSSTLINANVESSQFCFTFQHAFSSQFQLRNI